MTDQSTPRRQWATTVGVALTRFGKRLAFLRPGLAAAGRTAIRDWYDDKVATHRDTLRSCSEEMHSLRSQLINWDASVRSIPTSAGIHAGRGRGRQKFTPDPM